MNKMEAKLASPRKVTFFWDTNDLPKKLFQHYFNINFDDLVQLIRVYDVTPIQLNGKNAYRFYDIHVPYSQGYWLVKGLLPNRSYLAEIGVKLSPDEFFPLLRSNSITIPEYETVNNPMFDREVFQPHQLEEHPPKWREYVSTYSYYLDHGKNGEEK